MVSKCCSIPLAGLIVSTLFLTANPAAAQVFQTTVVDGPNGRIFYTAPASAGGPGVPAFDPWAYGYPFSALASALNFYGDVPNPADLSSAYYYAGVPELRSFPARATVSIATLTAPVPTSAPPAPAARPATGARVDVKVPKDATVWVQGQKSAQSGTVRHFVTGDLEPGFAYTYRIKASWTENGHKLIVEQPVTVRAGERESVTFVEGLAQARAERGR